MSAEELVQQLYDKEVQLTESPTDILRVERDDVTGIRLGTVTDKAVMNALNQGLSTPEALEALGDGMQDYRQRLEKQLESEVPAAEDFAVRVRPQIIDTAGATRMVGIRPGYEQWLSQPEDSVELFKSLKQISGHEQNILEKPPEERPDELYQMHRGTGELAGFPDCGVESYASGTRQNFTESLGIEEESETELRQRYGFLPTPETAMVIQDLEQGNLETVLEYASGERTVEEPLPETFDSRLSADFFPCDIDCQDAVNMGQQIEQNIEDPELETRYRASKAASVTEYVLGQYQVWKSDEENPGDYLDVFEEHAQNGQIPELEALETDHASLEEQLYRQSI